LSNDAPFLIDVTRLVWRRWEGRRPTGIDRVCLAYLKHFGGEAQAVVQHPQLRRILDQHASAALFEILSEGPGNFRRAMAGWVLRSLTSRHCDGAGRAYLNIGHTGLHDDGFR